MFNVFSIAASGMNAQQMRLNVVASNLANADSAVSSNGEPYRARQVVFETLPMGGDGSAGVKVREVVEDPKPLRMMYQPGHPLADDRGYVAMPNVNPVEEMVNMISAARSYQDNVEVLNTAKALAQKTLTMGQ